MERVMREIAVWGSIVFVEAVGPSVEDLNAGIDECQSFF